MTIAAMQSASPDGSGTGTLVTLTPSEADWPKTNVSACDALIDVLSTGMFQPESTLVAKTCVPESGKGFVNANIQIDCPGGSVVVACPEKSHFHLLVCQVRYLQKG